MNGRATFAEVLALWVAFAPMRSLAADPCGMVPPIGALSTAAITRIGVQKTYVFHKDGIASLVIRPGFTGSVEEFGMLVPFPSPPAVRKVPDNVFEQIAAAIDPPQVVVDLRPRSGPFGPATGGPTAPAAGAAAPLRYGEVRVLSREAVGMYEVAVLAAGSAQALARWMRQHGYRYPDGMDRACNDYVADGWCFVAVKTRVGSRQASAPRPGQRGVDARRPAGTRFSGHVQAMGFRFRTDELVVPMRLSTFNGGDPRNVVYLLTDRPRAIRNLPREFVKRQISGRRLTRNLTDLLPLRVIGGTLTPSVLGQYAPRRDPAPHNGVARELFNGDLEMARAATLSHPREVVEKRLLRIGEELGLRGEENDALIAAEIARQYPAAGSVHRDLRGMTLTVIDGAFPRDVLARENLTFVGYRMPSVRNRAGYYDAKVLGPAQRRGGALLPHLVTRPQLPRVPGLVLLTVTVGIAVQRRRARVRVAADAPLAIGDR